MASLWQYVLAGVVVGAIYALIAAGFVLIYQVTGLINFAAFPPDDRDFFVTRMWDIYLPPWRDIRSRSKQERDPEEEKRVLEEVTEGFADRRSIESHQRADEPSKTLTGLTRAFDIAGFADTCV